MNLVRGGLCADHRGDTHDRHNEMGRQVVDVDLGPECSGITSILQRAAEALCQTLEVSVHKPRTAGVERRAFHRRIRHQAPQPGKSAFAGRRVAGKRPADAVRIGFRVLDRGEHPRKVHVAVTLERGFEQLLLRAELRIHALSVDAQFLDQFRRAGTGVSLAAKKLDRPVEQIFPIVSLCTRHFGHPKISVDSKVIDQLPLSR